MPVQKYVDEANTLARSLADQGIQLRHHELLAKIATAHKANSWEALVSQETWGQTVLRWLRLPENRPEPACPVTRQEVFYRAQPLDTLCFGVSFKTGKQQAVSDSFLRRHTLVLGADGVGITVLLENLMLQQMARGGGFLYLDQFGDKGLSDSFRQGAEVTRTPMRVVRLGAGALGLYEAVLNAEGLLAPLPLTPRCEERKDMGRALLDEVRAMIDRLSQLPVKERPPRPFIIVIPNAHIFSDSTLSVLLPQARAVGVSFIFIERSLSAMTAVSEETAAAVLQCTWNKTFFRNNNALSALKEAEFLSAYGPEVVASIRRKESTLHEVLVQLWIGEAILLTGGVAERVHVQMVIPDRD